jgi:hypothetical protein
VRPKNVRRGLSRRANHFFQGKRDGLIEAHGSAFAPTGGKSFWANFDAKLAQFIVKFAFYMGSPLDIHFLAKAGDGTQELNGLTDVFL